MIKWEEINEGPIGFEKLAVEYVEDKFKYPGGSWVPTQPTRDGNKDAYTIVIGFHPGVDLEETWWMEAKYSISKKKTHLSRFRLDATVVSSIFNNRVSKIIFVTNIDIHSKTISDIRFALQKAIECNDVIFCTKTTLEYWLVQHPEAYKKYFQSELQVAPEDLRMFVSEDISLYQHPNQLSFSEKSEYIYKNCDYLAYFKIVSPQPQIIDIRPACPGVELNINQLSLDVGEQPVKLIVRFTDKFEISHFSNDGRETRQLVLFSLSENTDVLLKNTVSVISKTNIYLKIQSQDDLLAEYIRISKGFIKTPHLTVNALHGISGIGKSYVINRLLQDQSLKEKDTYFACFSDHQSNNLKQVLHLLYYLIFSYVSPKDISYNYLRIIQKRCNLPESLLLLTRNRNDYSKLTDCIKTIINNEDALLPTSMKVNPRFVFLDNVHKLSEETAGFLYLLIREMYAKDIPALIFLSGQSHFLETKHYLKIEQIMPVNVRQCIMNELDIITSIQLNMRVDLCLSPQILNLYFPNLIILIEFIKYVRLHYSENETASLNDFLLLYHQFINGSMAESLILDQFQNSATSQEIRNAYMAIYTSANGIPLAKISMLASELLQSGLVALDENNNLVPFHDYYCEIYRKANRFSKRDLNIDFVDVLDEARETVMYSPSVEDLEQVAEQISNLRKLDKFYSVWYILDSCFQSNHTPGGMELLRMSSRNDIYYNMFFNYAYAATNCSRTHVGNDLFLELYHEIKDITAEKTRLLKLDVLFELMNSEYNVFEYKKAMFYYGEFHTLYSLMARLGSVPKNTAQNNTYMLCECIRVNLQSSRGKKKSEAMFLRVKNILSAQGNMKQCADFCLRYAHTLYTYDLERALSYTKDAYQIMLKVCEHGSKLWCLASFQKCYLEILMTRDYSRISELETFAETSRKNFYSSYRHRNVAICALLYLAGDNGRADQRLLGDIAVKRKAREKLSGFYFETLALHYVSQGKIKDALSSLESAKEFFVNNKSYMKVIKHNYKLLSRQAYPAAKFDVYCGGAMRKDRYYIDPRSD